MHARSKFDGEKQIKGLQRGSWQDRCAGAVLRINNGYNQVQCVGKTLLACHQAVPSKQ